MTIIYFILFGLGICGELSHSYKFPANFEFGVATAAYQVEGAWNVSGKNDSIWDYYTHTFPEKTVDFSNGDVACNAYYTIDEDVKNLVKLKVNFYRFSIAWSRLLPTGFPNIINPDGVRYYNQLINTLLKNGIKPVVTLYHWDIPKSIDNLGGWTNEKIVDYIAEYAEVCFKLFGDRVKTWITLNEPYEFCEMGYGAGRLAPFVESDGIGIYQCGHNILLAHAKIYHIYNRKFKHKQKGKVGITIDTSWYEPNNSSLSEDREAAERIIQMYFGWFTHPIFSKEGDYPLVMRKRIDYYSKVQGFKESRLPRFTPQQVKSVRGAFDFMGLNHYTTLLCKLEKNATVHRLPSYSNDVGVNVFYNKNWEPTVREGARVVPWGMRKILNWIKRNYNNVEVYITENGYGGAKFESLNDTGRVNYYNKYLLEVLKAIYEDGCNVTKYTAWSYMDNYEWMDGYTMRFGMYHVDFDSEKRTRTPKQSAFTYQNVIVTREVDESLNLTKFLH